MLTSLISGLAFTNRK